MKTRFLFVWQITNRDGSTCLINDVVECDHWEDEVTARIQDYFDDKVRDLRAPVLVNVIPMSNKGLKWSDDLKAMILSV